MPERFPLGSPAALERRPPLGVRDDRKVNTNDVKLDHCSKGQA